MEILQYALIFMVVVLLQNCLNANGQFQDKSNDLVGSHDRVKRGIVNSSRFSDPCKMGLSCKINKDMEVPLCYCDDYCTEFNDCCFKYKPNPNAVHSRLNDYKPYLQCKLYIISEHRSSSMGIYLVSKCPKGFSNETISRACLYGVDRPVIDAHNVTFANRFCAFCHGVTSFKFWSFIVKADKDMCQSGVMDLLDNKQIDINNIDIIEFFNLKCLVTFEPPRDFQYRVCYTTKQESPSVFKKLCNGYLNPIKVIDHHLNAKVYRNFHCLDKKTTRSYSCLSDGDIYGPQKTFKNYDLTVMFNIHYQKTVKVSKTVKNNQTDQCFEIGCSPSNHSCPEYSVQVKNYPIKLSTVFVSNSSVDINTKVVQRLVSFYVSCLPIQYYKIWIQDWEVLIGKLNISVSSSNQVDNAIFIQINSRVNKFSKKEDVIKLEELFSHIELNYTEEIHVENESSSKVLFWTENRNKEKIKDMFISKRNINYNGNIAYDSLSILNKTRVPLKTNNCVPVNCNIRTSVYYDHSSNPKLLNFFLNEHVCSFEQTKKVSQVFITAERDFFYQNNTLDRVFIQSIMTYICLSVSSFAALNTFCIFLKLELFKSIAGVISQNVLIVIFLFNMLFMLGTGFNESPILCFVTGILTHYLALTYFLWITIFVVHTVVTIKTAKKFKKPNPNDQTRRLKMLVCFFGYSSPAIIVIPSVVIDSCNCTQYEIGYGGHACFPTSFPSNLAVFIVPAGLCIVINLLCLIYSAFVLSKLNTSMTHEGLQKSRSYVIVFLRICCVSAISWLLGVIAGILDEIIIGFCFIILSGLHGFIICVCLLSTNAFRDALQAYRNKNTSSGTEIEMIVADEDNMQTITHEAKDGVIED